MTLETESNPDVLQTRLTEEVALSQKLVADSEVWTQELKKKLSGLVRKEDALPEVCAFFAHWSLHLMKGIVILIQSNLYGGALLILRSLIEAHIELSFILHKDCGQRATEYLAASKENRPPYRELPLLLCPPQGQRQLGCRCRLRDVCSRGRGLFGGGCGDAGQDFQAALQGVCLPDATAVGQGVRRWPAPVQEPHSGAANGVGAEEGEKS
jgi:hypothetical protein